MPWAIPGLDRASNAPASRAALKRTRVNAGSVALRARWPSRGVDGSLCGGRPFDCYGHQIPRSSSDIRVTFRLAGNGWQWAAQSKQQAGGEFSIAQYVRFAADVTMPGAIDMAYDRNTHVVSLWFTPSTTPQVQFTPVGDFDVDRRACGRRSPAP